MSLSEDKIHKPSSKRLRNAAENGQFPYSSDLAVALALLTGCILVSLNAQNLTDKFVGFYREFYSTSFAALTDCLLYTSPSPRDRQKSRMPSSA